MDRSIDTERMILRPMTAEDADDVFEWTGDPAVNKYMPYPAYKKADDVKRWIESIQPSQNEFGFALKSTGKVIGSGSVRYDDDLQAYVFGYNLNHRYWGQGYATEAAKALISWAWQELGARDFAAVYADENVASGNVIRKCGLVFDHHLTYSKFDGSATFQASCMRARFDNKPTQ